MNGWLDSGFPGKQCGISLVELLIVVAIAALLMAGIVGVVGSSLQAESQVRNSNELTQQARFAMQRMVAAVQGTQRLLLPLADNPNTDWREQVREETVPASAPEGSSTKATAVLAVTLDPTLDRDGDGWADANNDKDYLDVDNSGTRGPTEPERVDEDLGDDANNDGMPGIAGIDDDGDGSVDESDAADFPSRDEDEEGDRDEDHADGIDNDNDGSVDEDITADSNKDFQAGEAGIDDDLDGTVDEGHQHDDDEDGLNNEDWLDPVVYYLNGGKLIERLPALSDINGDSVVTGADVTESVIAESVTRFRVERIPQGGGRSVMVDITLQLGGDNPENVELNTRVRVGGVQ